MNKELATLIIASILTLACTPAIQVEANPVPNKLIRMPYEYINANITVSDEGAHAKVNGKYPFENSYYSNISMAYPLLPNSTNVSVVIDENETSWWYLNETYRTIFGYFPMISWTIYPAPSEFAVNVDYEHTVPMIYGSYSFFYCMGTWKELEGIYNKQTTAYVTVDIDMNISDTETMNLYVCEITYDSTNQEWICSPLRYSVSRNNKTFRVSVIVISAPFRPILGDLMITFKKAEIKTVKIPENYSKIQTAIDEADYGDTIWVAAGTYYEQIDIWKPIHVVGESPVIDGNGTGSVVSISASEIEFSNFTLQNSGTDYYTCAGMYISGNRCNITGNTVRNNLWGIFLESSIGGNIFKNNHMTGNKYNFGVGYSWISLFSEDIDTSNTVNGKPIYFWINQHDKEIPEDAGYVAVVNSTNITVKDLSLIENGQGVLFVYTNYSLIKNVEIFDSFCGIDLRYSNNNTITHNNIQSVSSRNPYTCDECGIKLLNSKNNVMTSNNVSEVQEVGMSIVVNSYSNIINGNMISNSLYGIFINSNDNIIYHNNFVNNTQHAWTYSCSNAWDHNGEGNYWDGYSGVDANVDGIGDTPYTIDENNKDNFPLMEPYIIPEFPSFLILPLLMLATLLATIVYKRKHTM